jgi:hypothetical protein
MGTADNRARRSQKNELRNVARNIVRYLSVDSIASQE